MNENDDDDGADGVGERFDGEGRFRVRWCIVSPPQNVVGRDGQERRAHDGQERARDDRWEKAKELREDGRD